MKQRADKMEMNFKKHIERSESSMNKSFDIRNNRDNIDFDFLLNTSMDALPPKIKRE